MSASKDHSNGRKSDTRPARMMKIQKGIGAMSPGRAGPNPRGRSLHRGRSIRVLAVVMATAALWGLPALAQVITEFAIPSGPVPLTTPYLPGITAGHDGAVWFTGNSKIGRVSPDGQILELSAPGANDLAWGPDGRIWYTVFAPELDRLSLDGTIARYPVPTNGAAIGGITNAPDGNLWYSEIYVPDVPTGGFPNPCCAIGRMTTTGSARDFVLPSTSRPGTLVLGPDSRLWVQGGELRSALDGTISAVPLNSSGFQVDGMTLGPDGTVWFTASQANLVGSITTAGAVTRYPLPTPGSVPLGITAGPDSRLWFTEYGANRIGSITTNGTIAEYPIPTPNSGPKSITLGPDGKLWFIEASAGKIARIALGNPTSPVVLAVPAAASSHGINGTFFRSDLWLVNSSPTAPTTVTLTYDCFTGQTCGTTPTTITLQPQQSQLLQDVIGTTLGAPGTAGAIQISYEAGTGPVSARSRVFTTTASGGAFGTTIPAIPFTRARSQALFLGLSSSGSDLSIGFRSNAGAFNPSAQPTTVTFSLYDQTGATLGATTKSFGAHEAAQLSPNIFALVGAGTVITNNAYLVVTATAPIFPYVIVIDNQTGDPSYLTPTEEASAP